MNSTTTNQGSTSCAQCSNLACSEVSDVSSLTCSEESSLDPVDLKCINDVYGDTLKEQAQAGDCSFYIELEGVKKCGPNGYLIHYGYINTEINLAKITMISMRMVNCGLIVCENV